MKYLHILSNVTYGGGEEVLLNLVTSLPDLHCLLLLRRSEKLPNNSCVYNKSPLKSKDSYSLLQQGVTFLLLIIILLHIRLSTKRVSLEYKLVFHGFPCQFAMPIARILFPDTVLYFIYHQIKHPRIGIGRIPYRIFLQLEYIALFLASPLSVGAPSLRSLYSVRNTVIPANTEWTSGKRLKLFHFKNCISPFPLLGQNDAYLKDNLDISWDNFILIVGRFQTVKGQLRLLEFINTNRSGLGSTNFIFAGSGPTLTRCRAYVSRQKLENVHFLGSVPRSNLAILYSSCLCTFLPSYEESYGVALYESAFFKKNVLVFSSSLLVEPFVKLVDINSTSFSSMSINSLCKFPQDSKHYLFTPEDTHESLELCSFKDNMQRNRFSL